MAAGGSRAHAAAGKGTRTSTRNARYHAFGVLAGLSLLSSGLWLTGTSPTAAPVNPCDIRLAASPSVPSTPSASPVTSASPSPDASQPATAPGPSDSPTPSTSPAGQLCARVQSLSGSRVLPGRNARYAIWVWFAGTATGDVMVAVTARPGRLSPTFTVCPLPGTAVCSITATGQPAELVAQVAVPQQEAGTRLTLAATAVSPAASSPVAAQASVSVKRPPKPEATPTSASPTPGTSTPVGVGATTPLPTLPPATLPPGTGSPGVLAATSLPVLPDPATSPSLVLPQVTPQPSATQPAHPIPVTDLSAQFPLDRHILGGQIAGLAALAAAVTIAVARLSLRKQRPRQEQDASSTSD